MSEAYDTSHRQTQTHSADGKKQLALWLVEREPPAEMQRVRIERVGAAMMRCKKV